MLAGLGCWLHSKLIHTDFAGAMLTIAPSPSLPLFVFCAPYLPSLPSCRLLSPCSSSSASLLNAGGFSYAGMQSSSQSQFSYSPSQGSRARTQSSDINEALYNLDRVLYSKSTADKHESTGLSRKMRIFVSFIAASLIDWYSVSVMRSVYVTTAVFVPQQGSRLTFPTSSSGAHSS